MKFSRLFRRKKRVEDDDPERLRIIGGFYAQEAAQQYMAAETEEERTIAEGLIRFETWLAERLDSQRTGRTPTPPRDVPSLDPRHVAAQVLMSNPPRLQRSQPAQATSARRPGDLPNPGSPPPSYTRRYVQNDGVSVDTAPSRAAQNVRFQSAPPRGYSFEPIEGSTLPPRYRERLMVPQGDITGEGTRGGRMLPGPIDDEPLPAPIPRPYAPSSGDNSLVMRLEAQARDAEYRTDNANKSAENSRRRAPDPFSGTQHLVHNRGFRGEPLPRLVFPSQELHAGNEHAANVSPGLRRSNAIRRKPKKEEQEEREEEGGPVSPSQEHHPENEHASPGLRRSNAIRRKPKKEQKQAEAEEAPQEEEDPAKEETPAEEESPAEGDAAALTSPTLEIVLQR